MASSLQLTGQATTVDLDVTTAGGLGCGGHVGNGPSSLPRAPLLTCLFTGRMELLTTVDSEVTRAARNGVVYLEWWGGGGGGGTKGVPENSR